MQFPEATLLHLQTNSFDHIPILINVNSILKRKSQKFRFNYYWAKEEEF